MKDLTNIIIKENTSIKEALKLMDEDGRKIVFVVGIKEIFKGTVTDGDVRRWLLKGNSIQDKVSKVMNTNPIVLNEGYNTEDAKKLIVTKKIECIPVLSKNKKIISVVWWPDFFEKKTHLHENVNIPVIIMAGGKGVRLHPYTNILPKPLMPIGEKPILEHIIDRFVDYGCKNFYLSLNYKSNIIKAYFSDFKHSYTIDYVEEDKPLGTGGSLCLLKNKINETFCVTNCDILIDANYADVLKSHKDNKNKITIVTSMKNFVIPYGVCEISKTGELKNIKEKPEFDFLINTGMYILEPEVFKFIPNNKFYNMTDLITDCMKKNLKVGVYPISEKSWIDIGRIEELEETLKKLEVK